MADYDNREQFLELLDLMHEARTGVGIQIPQPARVAEIDELAEELGASELYELRPWLHMTAGPILTPDPLLCLVRSRGVISTLSSMDVLDRAPLLLAKKWIPIASDECGNFYCYPIGSDFGGLTRPVFFVESPHIDAKIEYVVASSLYAFTRIELTCAVTGADYPTTRAEHLELDPEFDWYKAHKKIWELG